MAHNIGKLIAELRRSKGWTQLELAEKLSVSDKAVSKWETDDSYPSIEFFPKLATLFGVSIDYLMTGKAVDNVNLDDMDSTKRMLYLIEYDDAENYIKYGYEKTTYFDDLPSTYRRSGTADSAISNIIKNKSYKIFKACVDAGAPLNPRSNNYNTTYVGAMYEHIDELIMLACLAGSVEFLEKIDFRSFGIGDKKSQLSRTYNGSHITSRYYMHTYDINTNYLINNETLDFIYDTPEIPDNIIEYVSTYIPRSKCKTSINTYIGGDYGKLSGTFYFLENHVIKKLYETKRYELLNTYLEELEADMPSRSVFEELRCYSSHQVSYRMHGNYFIKHDSNSYGVESLICKIASIPQALFELAASRRDREWLNRFLSYNQKLSKCITKDVPVKPYVMTEKEIEREFLLNSDLPLKDKIVIECTKDGILYLKQLEGKLRELAQSELSESQKTDKAPFIQKCISLFKKYMPDILEENYISYYELICALLLKGDYKKVFEFAVDNSLTEIATALIENKPYQDIEILAKSLFLFTEEEVKCYSDACEKTKQERERVARRNGTTNQLYVLEHQSKILNRVLSRKKYETMVRHQITNLPIEKLIDLSTNLEYWTNEKKQFYSNLIASYENMYEQITHERELADAHSKVMNEITKDYLLKLLQDGQTETLVIKLCVKLESVLKNQFRYDGDLVDMVNELHKITVYEYDYYGEDCRKKEKYPAEMFDTLYKLRTARNAYVHAGANNAEIDMNTLERCIDWIEQLSSEKNTSDSNR